MLFMKLDLMRLGSGQVTAIIVVNERPFMILHCCKLALQNSMNMILYNAQAVRIDDAVFYSLAMHNEKLEFDWPTTKKHPQRNKSRSDLRVPWGQKEPLWF